MNMRLCLTGVLISVCISFLQAQTIAVPDGYAGYAGTTGGGGATPITVSTASEFKSAVGGSSSAVIIVNGMINMGGDVSIGSNKTIVGANASSGLSSGCVKIQGTNCIIQNLTLGPSSGDVMEISGATKVFITKCSFFDSSDELCSIVREADYVTVSWCKFYFDNPDSHSFVHLIGNGDDRISDRGKLHVTLHHNWYAEGIRGRMPRVRFGHVHIYNNYHNSVGNGYCIGAGYECHIRVENTHFDNINNPWADYGATTSGGVMGWDNLLFEGCYQPTFIANTYPVFTLPYEFDMHPTEVVEVIVKKCSGNVFCDVTSVYPSVTITSPSDSTTFPASSNITINADASITDGIINSVKFYYDDSLLNEDNSAPYSYTWKNVKSGVYTLSATATDTNDVTGLSNKVTIIVGSGVAISNPINGSEFDEPADITINANAWDRDGSISSVEFFQGATSLGIDTIEPHSYVWNDVPAGNYTLTAKATDNDNNVYTSEEVSVVVTGGTEGIDKVNTEVMSIYPNPVSDKLMLSLSENLSGNVRLTIYNSMGKIVLKETLSGSEHILDLKDLHSGVYVITLTSNYRNVTRKIIKTNNRY